MFYPKHKIREYCLYLGSLELIDGKKYDLGVYEELGGRVSHAIVSGESDSEYISGDIRYMSNTALTKLNWEFYMQHLGAIKGGMPAGYEKPEGAMPSSWLHHPDYPMKEWAAEVRELNYWEWIIQKIKEEDYE